MAEYVDLIDNMGPYRGVKRPYSKTAAENALATGWARRPNDPEPEVGPPASPPEVEQAPEGPEVEAPSDDDARPLEVLTGGTSEEEPPAEADAEEAVEEESDEEVEEVVAATPLPEDFPFRALVIESGIETLEAARAVEDWTSVPQVAEGRAKKIVAYMDALED